MVISNSSNRLALRLTTISSTALVAAALFSASVVHAQAPIADSRWQAYAGCWEPIDGPTTVGARTSGSMVCIVPAANGRSVEVASISNNKVVHLDRLNTSGERV